MLDVERANLLKPGNNDRSYVEECLGETEHAVVAVSDYTKALPLSIAKAIKQPFLALGTDGFGRSEGRSSLRDFFEVDERYIVVAALSGLEKAGRVKIDDVKAAIKKFNLDPEKTNPMISHWAG